MPTLETLEQQINELKEAVRVVNGNLQILENNITNNITSALQQILQAVAVAALKSDGRNAEASRRRMQAVGQVLGVLPPSAPDEE